MCGAIVHYMGRYEDFHAQRGVFLAKTQRNTIIEAFQLIFLENSNGTSNRYTLPTANTSCKLTPPRL